MSNRTHLGLSRSWHERKEDWRFESKLEATYLQVVQPVLTLGLHALVVVFFSCLRVSIRAKNIVLHLRDLLCVHISECTVIKKLIGRETIFISSRSRLSGPTHSLIW